MKKILAILICFCLIMFHTTSYASDNAQAGEVKEKIAVVKERIGNTDEFSDFKSNVTNYNNGTYAYNFSWENKDPYKSLQVTINQDYIITNYYLSDNEPYSSAPSFVYRSQKEIIEAAKKWFSTINPEIVDEFSFTTNDYADLYSQTYTVFLKGVRNGIEIDGYTGSITLTKNLQKVTGMRLNYKCITEFDNSEDIISPENAKKAFIDKLGYKLCYNINYISGKREAVLKYVPDFGYSEYIDALNGEVFDFIEYNDEINAALKSESSNDMLTSGGGGGGGVKFSDAELSEISKIEGLLSSAEIENKLKNNKYLNIAPDAKLNYTRLTRDYYDDEKYICRVEFSKDDEFIYASVDAEDCTVINFSRYDGNKKDTSQEKLSFEKLNKIAKDASKNLAAKYFTGDPDNTLKFSETIEETPYFNAVRIVNGVEVLGNGIYMSVDEYTGFVQHYSIEWYDIEFPDVSNVNSLDKAYEELFKKVKYTPLYLPVKNDETTLRGKLVYDFELSNINQDAFSGKLESYVEEKEKITDYSDISGHYVENIINQLKSFGIGFTGGEFKPDEIITQGEFVTLLAYVFRRGVSPIIQKTNNDFSQSYSFVRNKNLINEEEIDENAEVTREKACKMLVKAMGYDEVAKMENIFISSFNDVLTNKGYIAILNEKNIVAGDGNGNFNPHKSLTRAEAVILLYNYLTK